MVAGASLFAGISLIGVDTSADAKVAARLTSATVRAEADAVVPPAPEPLQFQSVAPQDAVAINAAVPILAGPNPAAKPFKLLGSGDLDRSRAIDASPQPSITRAATEPTDGQRAVAQVVLNRVRHPAFPKSVCGVVYQGAERSTGCQFTFTCDGSLRRLPMASYWQRARKVAEEALAGQVYAPVGYSTHYHTNWVVPYWSSSLAKVANVGTHIFYRWAGGWGKPPAFAQRYAGAEPVINLAVCAPALQSRRMRSMSRRLMQPPRRRPKPIPPGPMPPASTASSGPCCAATSRLQGPAVGKLLADQATQVDVRDKDASSHRWAMTGDGLGTSGAPLGKAVDAKVEVKKPEQLKPQAPLCLGGVRKAGQDAPTCS